MYLSETWDPSSGFLRLSVQNNGMNSSFSYMASLCVLLGTFEYSSRLSLPAAVATSSIYKCRIKWRKSSLRNFCYCFRPLRDEIIFSTLYTCLVLLLGAKNWALHCAYVFKLDTMSNTKSCMWQGLQQQANHVNKIFKFINREPVLFRPR